MADLPAPVGITTSTSCPDMTASMASSCPGRRSSKPNRLRASWTAASRGGRATVCGSGSVFGMSSRLLPHPATHKPARGFSRHLNQALYVVVLTRLRTDPATRAYAQRRRAQGKTHREIKRCLIRYVARQLYRLHETQPALDATEERPAEQPRAGTGRVVLQPVLVTEATRPTMPKTHKRMLGHQPSRWTEPHGTVGASHPIRARLWASKLSALLASSCVL